MNLLPLLSQIEVARITAEEILCSRTKEELNVKIELVKQCIEQDRSISDLDKEFFKNWLDLFKKRFEVERGW